MVEEENTGILGGCKRKISKRRVCLSESTQLLETYQHTLGSDGFKLVWAEMDREVTHMPTSSDMSDKKCIR